MDGTTHLNCARALFKITTLRHLLPPASSFLYIIVVNEVIYCFNDDCFLVEEPNLNFLKKELSP